MSTIREDIADTPDPTAKTVRSPLTLRGFLDLVKTDGRSTVPTTVSAETQNKP
jgi:hypothetical protein